MVSFIHWVYFFTAILFILGLKKMSSPKTARNGIVWAGWGMLLATLVTFGLPEITGLSNVLLIVIAIAIGGGIAWYSGQKVAMTGMPQMIALYNGMGGGAAAAIAAVELFRAIALGEHYPDSMLSVLGPVIAAVAIIGALIGAVAFSGSLVAWGKLDGRLKKSRLFSNQQWFNIVLAVITLLLALWVYAASHYLPIILFFIAALILGFFITIPIGGADMPVVISLFNALTGLAVALEGYVLQNPAMIIAGTVVGASGTLLTQLMAKAMNRSLVNVLFSGFGTVEVATSSEVEGTMKEIQPDDAAIMMAYANKVIIVPGYGMAVAQAQHKIWEFAELLEQRGVIVKFAIHPVAGRMPGHMNVLLAEAGVPYDKIYDMDEINNEFKTTDVALVIGANDVVNPSAKNDKSSPLYGMPTLHADEAKNVIVIKRGKGRGFSGIENALFYEDNCHMLYGDGQKVGSELIQAIKGL